MNYPSIRIEEAPGQRVGNSNIRNPILVSYVAKGLLPVSEKKAS